MTHCLPDLSLTPTTLRTLLWWHVHPGCAFFPGRDRDLCLNIAPNFHDSTASTDPHRRKWRQISLCGRVKH